MGNCKSHNQYILPVDSPVVAIEADVAFQGLTLKEKLYAHFLSKASWIGGLVIPVQVSPESPIIWAFLFDLFKTNGIEELRNIALERCNWTQIRWKQFLIYSAGIFDNKGNYKGDGDTKIIPELSTKRFGSLVNAANFSLHSPSQVKSVWKYLSKKMWSLSPTEKQLGFGDKGATTYWSPNCTSDDAALVSQYLRHKGLEAWMTRVFKTQSSNGTNHYEIRSPSARNGASPTGTSTVVFEGAEFSFTQGDYAPIMERMVYYLEQAKRYAANDNQIEMLESYAKCFTEGSLEAHKEGSRFWVMDKASAVESYIGFIENDRDPDGARAEFLGFVSVVNREKSKKFDALVDRAPEFLDKLPWPKEFEKDFKRPGFTCLDVLAYSCSEIPIGVKLPNYEEFAENEGSKNFELSNVIAADSRGQKILDFLSEADKDLMLKYRIRALELQTGLHELLGHGSGKLLQKMPDGSFNFPAGKLTDPLSLTGESVKSFYQPSENYESVFSSLGSAFEECRAEVIGYVLSCEKEILRIFGLEGEEAQKIKYTNWLAGIGYVGLKSLEMYQPDSGTWGQPHCQAAFVILRVLLKAGQNFTTVQDINNAQDGKPDLLISMDRTKIDSVGRPALEKFLLRLQVYRSTANILDARKMFNNYSQVDKLWRKRRAIVMRRKKPRWLAVLPNTILKDGSESPTLKSYESTVEGLIQSWIERFNGEDSKLVYEGLYYCIEKDKKIFSIETPWCCRYRVLKCCL